MRKIPLIACCLVVSLFSLQSFAQTKVVGGEFAAGVRLGGTTALTVKKYSGHNTSALEFMAGWNFDKSIDGFNISGMWEKLAPLNASRKLNAEFGFGATAIFGDKVYFGPSGIIGFDWRLKSIPITMSFDWMPTLIVLGKTHFSGANGAFSIRWILNHRKYQR
jgi:hypothetical protein